MLAVDTNIIVRYLTRDDSKQARRAEALLNGQAIFVSTTVLLETEWVLRQGYGFAPAVLVSALRSLAGLPNVTLEEPIRIASALDWAERGLDFADALHVAAARDCAAFVTFDKALDAARLDGITVRMP
jgi:predicted nucleic-acid-binding protein